MGVSVETALKIRCPLCMAGPGRPCLTVKRRQQVTRDRLHHERVQAAGRQLAEPPWLAEHATYD